MAELGRPKLYLGIKFAFDESGTWMHVHHYIEKLLQKFGMECSPLRIPMNLGQVLRKDVPAPLVDRSYIVELLEVSCLPQIYDQTFSLLSMLLADI
jgi:hypothetical protein